MKTTKKKATTKSAVSAIESFHDFVKNHLKIKVTTKRHPGGYDDMTVQLLLDEEVISQDMFFTKAK